MALDPLSDLAPPPMGSNVYNDELKKNILDFEKINQSKDVWALCKYLFLNRRFIEASILMSNILKERPHFHEARNWRARALFFLGNPKKAIKELKYILENNPKEEERLDALYCLGAFVYEMENASKDEIREGLKAWEQYLAHKNIDKTLKNEVMMSKEELKNRLKPKKDIEDPKANEEILLARSYIKDGRVKEALNLLLKIAKKYPNLQKAHHYLGMAHMMNNDPKKAILAWQKTKELDKKYADEFNLDQRISVAKSMLNK